MEEQMSFQELQAIVSMLMDELIEQKKSNETMQAQLQATNQILSKLIGQQEGFLQDFTETKENIATSLRIQDYGLNNLKYELADPRVQRESFFYPEILPIDTTIDEIVKEHRSLSRFGDGEFAIMAGKKRQKFQAMDSRLQEKLIQAFSSKDERILIAIADNYGSLEKYSRAGKSGIRAYMTETVRLEHKQFIDLNRKYHNAYISRPCVLFADCETDAPGKRFDALKTIWQQRDVIMIEGAQTRLGVGNDLFECAKSIRRIEGPAENSFSVYDDLLRATHKYASNDTLLLLAMGPTATALAYDLGKEGLQAVDIGHLDLEYEWYLRGGRRCAIDTKYNNEVAGGEHVKDIFDTVYESQILENIC